MTAGQIGSGITGLKVSERGADAIDYSEGLEALLETAEAAGVALDTIFDPELAARVERWRRLGELSAELDEMGNLSDADWEALDALRQDTSIQAQSLGDIFGAVFEQMRDWLLAADALPERAEQDGYQTGQGLAEGMYESGDLVAAAGTYLGETAAAAIEAALDIHSPSRVMAELGQYAGEGFALGIEDSLAQIREASATMSGSRRTQNCSMQRSPPSRRPTATAGQPMNTSRRSSVSPTDRSGGCWPFWLTQNTSG